MTDRIANHWGKRTPFGPGENWSSRVDEFLKDGVCAEEVDRWTQTASLHHANGNAMDLAVKDGRLVGGRAVDRANRGRLDPKDLSVWQAYDSSGGGLDHRGMGDKSGVRTSCAVVGRTRTSPFSDHHAPGSDPGSAAPGIIRVARVIARN